MEATYLREVSALRLGALTSQCFMRRHSPSFKMEWLVLRETNTFLGLGDKWLILKARAPAVAPHAKSMTEFLRMTKP